MSEISDTMLLEYADGHVPLDQAQRDMIERALAASPVLRARLEALEATRPDSSLWRVFDQPMSEPVPQHLVELVMSGPRQGADSQSPAPALVPSLGERLRNFLFPAGGFGAPSMAFAALVAVGVTAGVLLYANRDVSVDAQVATALETLPSGLFDARATDGAIVPTASFESKDGSICRRYAVAAKGADPAYAATACRQPTSGRWIIQARGPVTPSEAARPGTVVPSSGPDAAAFDAVLKRLMAADLMGPADEKRAMARGWKK